MSRSPVACSCGTVLADRRHTGIIIRRGISLLVCMKAKEGVMLICPMCGRGAPLPNKKVVAFDVR